MLQVLNAVTINNPMLPCKSKTTFTITQVNSKKKTSVYSGQALTYFMSFRMS